MKSILVLGLAAVLALGACQKQQTEEERRAEINRQVEQKLAEERKQQDIAQREADLNAREQTLADKQRATATPAPVSRSTSTTTNRQPPSSRNTAENRTTRPTRAGGSYDMFYNRLESHGDWMETDDYGYVWQPRQAQSSRSWRPYTDGRWVYTDAGWTWVSEESFGWATYHYGRWARLRNIGWVWVPGDEWAPAWVSWRTSNEYVGWAPLPPEARFDRSTGIHKWADSYYDIGPENYAFVQSNQIGQPRLERVVVPQERNLTIVNQTTNVTNITYNNTTIINQGPNYDELRAQSQQPIERLRIERESDIQSNDPRAVVRGEVISFPAPVIVRAEAVAPPPIVKQRIKQVFIERGWDAIADKNGAQEARRKVRAEAPPPSQEPAPPFIKPAVAPATSPETSASVAATAEPTRSAPSATATVAASMPAATPKPAMTPLGIARSTATPSASPTASPVRSATATPAPSAAPEESAKPTATPRATATATVKPSATAAPSPSATPRPSLAPRFTPRPSATPSAAAESSPVAETTPSRSNGSPLNARETGASRHDLKVERKAEKQQRKFGAEAASQTPARGESEATSQLNASGNSTPIPTPSATPRPTATPRPVASVVAEPSSAPAMDEPRGPRGMRNRPTAVSESATVSPTPADAATDEDVRGKKQRKREKKRGLEEESDTSPTATPTPAE